VLDLTPADRTAERIAPGSRPRTVNEVAQPRTSPGFVTLRILIYVFGVRIYELGSEFVIRSPIMIVVLVTAGGVASANRTFGRDWTIPRPNENTDA